MEYKIITMDTQIRIGFSMGDPGLEDAHCIRLVQSSGGNSSQSSYCTPAD